jgi:hypothetical protein
MLIIAPTEAIAQRSEPTQNADEAVEDAQFEPVEEPEGQPSTYAEQAPNEAAEHVPVDPLAWWHRRTSEERLFASIASVLAVAALWLGINQYNGASSSDNSPQIVPAYYAEPHSGTTYPSVSAIPPGYVGPYYTVANGNFMLAAESHVDSQGNRKTQPPCNHGIPVSHIGAHPVFQCN